MNNLLFKRTRAYLDWASAAPVARVAMHEFAATAGTYGNPSSPHAEGVAAQAKLEEARLAIARLAEVKRDGVIFTSGATEANTLAIAGHVARLRADGIAAANIHILYLPSAHASIVETIASLSRQGVAVESLTLAGRALDLDDLVRKLRPTTRLVTLDGVCGETGMRYPTRAVRTALDSYTRSQSIGRSDSVTPGATTLHFQRILLHVDASQVPFAAPFDLTRLSADLVTLDAQKVGGVRGIGALCVRSYVRLAPILAGGGQEHGLRPGTEPVALAAAFAAALSDAAAGSARFAERALEMRRHLVSALLEGQRIPGLHVNEGKDQAPHILNLSLVGRDTDYLVMLLDRAGFAVSTKSACESNSARGSRAVRALTGDSDRAASTLRVSWGSATSQLDLDRFAAALIDAVAFLDTHALA